MSDSVLIPAARAGRVAPAPAKGIVPAHRGAWRRAGASAAAWLARHPLAWRAVLFIVLPLLLAGVAARHVVRASLPETGAAVQEARGLAAAVRVDRDAQGVPHVRAASARDAYYTLGWLHAQDRLWQLEVQRRVAAGRLSEIFGSATLKQDLWMRTLGLPEAARSSWNALSPQARESLSAYAEGINAWVATHPQLPPEFAMFGVHPEPWTVFDSLAWIKVFALDLAGNLDREIAWQIAAQTMSPAQLETFFGAETPEVAAVATPPAAAHDEPGVLAGLYDAHRAVRETLHVGGRFVGSNAWAVAGSRAEGGRALLANDPHLGLRMPSLWYAATLEGGPLKTAGMTLVGLPVVVFGRNDHIAWGGTSLPADVQDLYIEQVDPHDPGRYRVGDHWERFAVRTEEIVVRPAFPQALREPLQPVRVTLRTSRHGPIVTDALGGALAQPIALRWTALDAGDTTYESFFRLGLASDWAGFREALHYQVAPTLNMLYADERGHIGFAAAGRVPVRRGGDGSRPSDGASDAHEWIGWVAPQDMPQRYDPPAGVLVSANDEGLYRDARAFFTHDWASPGRARRIAQLLDEHSAHGPLSVDQMAAMQADVRSLPAQALAARLAALPPRDAREGEALGRLARWDGGMEAGSAPAAIFNVWMRHLRHRVFLDAIARAGAPAVRDPAGAEALATLVDELPLDRLAEALDDPRHPWCDETGPRGCATLALDALDDALAELDKQMGADMAAWRWGTIHHTVYAHVPLSQVKLLDTVFGRRVQSGGSVDSIAVANAVYEEGAGYRQTFGAGFRQVMSPGASGAGGGGVHLYINSTGESGQAASPHYADMVGPCAAGRTATLAWRVPRPQAGSVTLRPAPSSTGAAS